MHAFTPSKIAHWVDIPQNSIGTVLKRLEGKNLVRHKGGYWAITDDEEQLRGLTQYQLATETANEFYGEENPGEWIPHMPDEETEDEADQSSGVRWKGREQWHRFIKFRGGYLGAWPRGCWLYWI